MEIIFTLFNKTLDSFHEQFNRFSPFFRRFQIDIADGIFVPNKTISIDDVCKFFTNHQSLITNNYLFDFHLMVKDYKKEIIKLKKMRKLLNIKSIFIHYSISPHSSLLTPCLAGSPRCEAGRQVNSQLSVGLALDPQDKVESVAKHYHLKNIPSIQIMSVIPGFQGQPFIEATLNKIRELRQLGYQSEIFIDGSVNGETVPIISSHKHRPNFLCIGSYLIKSTNLVKTLKSLKQYCVVN